MHTPNYDYVGGANRSTSLRHCVTEKDFPIPSVVRTAILRWTGGRPSARISWCKAAKCRQLQHLGNAFFHASTH